MAQDKPKYETVTEAKNWIRDLIDKYPDMYYGIKADKITCVKVTNKPRDSKKKPYEVTAVKMPVLMDAPYGWYITVWSNIWDAMDEHHKLLLLSEALFSIPVGDSAESEGKLIPCDTKGYGIMYRTFKSIDYLSDPNVPHLLQDDIQWVQKAVDEDMDDE